MDGVKEKIVALFNYGVITNLKDIKTKTKTHKEEIKQSEDNITKDVRNLFRFLKESELKIKYPETLELFESEK